MAVNKGYLDGATTEAFVPHHVGGGDPARDGAPLVLDTASESGVNAFNKGMTWLAGDQSINTMLDTALTIMPGVLTLYYTAAGAGPQINSAVSFSPTFQFAASSPLLMLSGLFTAKPIWKNVNGIAANLAIAQLFNANQTFRADGATITGGLSTDFVSNPVYDVINSGVMTGASHTGFASNFHINTSGQTVATRIGFSVIESVITGGTLTNQIGVDVPALSAAGTSNIGIKIAKASTYSLQLSSTDGTAAGGITWGTDAQLYRSGTSILTTTAQLNTVTGTNALAPIQYTSGVNLTNAVAGAREFDGAQHYATIDTTSGRGAIPTEQYFRLTADGGTISTIANFFGSTSNISLVANAYYEIEIFCWFLNTTGGTVVWTFTNSAAPTSQNIHYRYSPIGGVNTGAGGADYLEGDIVKDATATKALTVSGTLTTAVDHYAHFKIWLQNGTGTSLKIQATKAVGGTITPRLGSYYKVRRLPASSTGTFAA